MANNDIRSTELLNKKELMDALDPFARVMAITDKMRPVNNDEPLRNVLPGIWPTVKDLRRLYIFGLKHGWKLK